MVGPELGEALVAVGLFARLRAPVSGPPEAFDAEMGPANERHGGMIERQDQITAPARFPVCKAEGIIQQDKDCPAPRSGSSTTLPRHHLRACPLHTDMVALRNA
ncbi:hypothetical protein MN608_06248 [Microdochium nivale]|nr:hypothetical protein MN608_06248 [Microdochium nivale]